MSQRHLSALPRLWSLSTFRAFWLASTLSNLGTSAYVMAMSWLTVRLYGSHGIALLALGYGIPQLLLELFGGAAADRTARRKLYMATESALFLVAAVLWLVSIKGVVPLWLLVAVSACNGVISAFDTPARTALIGEMVCSEDLVVAQQVFSVSSQITAVFGPALGGVLLSIGGRGHANEEWAFLFNVASYLPIILCFPFLPRVPSVDRALRQRLQVGDVLVGIRQGLVYVASRHVLVVLMQLLAVVMLLGLPFQALLPIFVHDSAPLGSDHTAYAALLSAVGFGGLVGSLVGVASTEQRPRFIALALASLGLGCSLLLLTFSRVIYWSSLSAFLAGAFSVFAINLDMALLQGLTVPQMQGRVSSIASLGKGLQSLIAAAASEAIGLLSHSPLRSSAFALVQGGLALALIVISLCLWGGLSRLSQPKVLSG
jgi:MFS family permease